MAHIRVFLGAPSYAELASLNTQNSYQWQTVSSDSNAAIHSFPAATLEAASRRISLLYQNIIFQDSDQEDIGYREEMNAASQELPNNEGQTTTITWPPTAPNFGSQKAPGGEISFLRPSASVSRIRSQLETQETQETGSYDYSDASSIARFPAFHFNLNKISSLSSLSEKGPSGEQSSSRKVAVLVAVLEVEGPDTIRVKKGVDAGKEVSILRMIIGDDEGAICKLTAWRDVADRWGGSYSAEAAPGIKRGDIVHLENVLVTTDQAPSSSSPTLTASPYLNSRMEICFRTMPRCSEDARLRPDLRLGFSDAAVRKVAAVAAWFESMAGLPPR